MTAAYLAGESSIRSRGLAYSSPEVYAYVSHVAWLYRARRLEAARLGSMVAYWCSLSGISNVVLPLYAALQVAGGAPAWS